MPAGRPALASWRAFAPVRGESMSAAGRKAIARQALCLWKAGEALRASGSVAAVHDWRVAARRLRFALRLWSPWLGPAKPLRDALGRLGRILGGLRDQDILCQAAARLQGSRRSWKAWQQALLEERNRRLAGFLLRLQTQACRKLWLRLIEWVREPGATGRGRAEEAGREACRLLQKKAKKVLRAGARSGAQLSDEELHRLRIAFKRLRYACEFYAPYLPRSLKKFMRKWVQYQDCLGAHQDAAAVMRLARGWQGRRVAGLAPAALASLMAALLKQEKLRAKTARREFKKLWRKFPMQVRVFTQRLRRERSRPSPAG